MLKRDGELMKRIRELKARKSIYIIAHYYQREEIQEIADFVGDSYAMALAAKDADTDKILVAGVDFMAETAAILCPGKTILSPEPMATCPMAESVDIREVLEYKEKKPDTLIVSYVNTPAEIKAISDVCVTSSNAQKIIEKLPQDKSILFLPDKNLAAFIERQTGRKMEVYPSCCPIHAKVTAEEINRLKVEYPQAHVLVHPECSRDVVELADYAGSTGGILNYVCKAQNDCFIIGTECGIFHAIHKARPEIELILASEELICPNMKSITLEKVLYSLEAEETIISVSEDISNKAVRALQKMIDLAS